VVESQLIVGGIPVQVLDTAGIRETLDTVEKIGVQRSHQAAQQADLILLTIDALSGWTTEDNEIYQQVKHRPLILIINKTDLATPEKVNYPSEIQHIVQTIAAQNKGIDDLEKVILEAINVKNLTAANLDFAINQRQAAVLTQAKLSLEQVQQTINNQLPLDFWTIDLRIAIQSLGEITGEDVTESVLERIFSRFCIGK
jgi:tRNA modification GTPase